MMRQEMNMNSSYPRGCYPVDGTARPEQHAYNNSSSSRNGGIASSGSSMPHPNASASGYYRREDRAASPRGRPRLSLITSIERAHSPASTIAEEDDEEEDNNSNPANAFIPPSRRRKYRFSSSSSSNYFTEQPTTSSERLAGNISPRLQPKHARRIRRDGAGSFASYRDYTYLPSNANDGYNSNNSSDRRCRSLTSAVNRKPRGTPPPEMWRALGYISSK